MGLLGGGSSLLSPKKFGNVAGGNYSEFEADGTLKFNGNATVFNDIYLGLSGAKVPASNAPTWAAFTTNTAAYTFDIDDYIDINPSEMLHGWKEGSDIELHLHWAVNGAEVAEKAVKWQVFYTWGDINEAFAAESNTSAETTISTEDADKTHKYTDLGTVSGSGFKIGSCGMLRLKRITATGDPPTNDPYGLMIGIHYQIDTIGSRLEETK